MAEQELNLANVGARFKQVTGKGMAHGMRRDRFRNFGNAAGFPVHLRNRSRGYMLVRRAPGKSQCPGLSIRHQARRISNSFGESIT